MKPTTTWVFVSPVHPQSSRSRTIQGSFGSAAGAHAPDLPVAQDGQTKRLPGWPGGKLGFLRACRPLIVLMTAFGCCAGSCGLVQAEPESAPKRVIEPVRDANPCDSGSEGIPAMVVIRPGRFTMGSPKNETGRGSEESPQHPVTIPAPFALSRCEITVGQFRRFIQDSGYETTAEKDGKGCWIWKTDKKTGEQEAGRDWDSPGFSQTDEHPVTCVSWVDAQRYVDWLSQRSGAWYRLPTEAEWEYAARSDTQSARYYGEKSQCDYANGASQETKEIAGKNWTLADCADGAVYTAAGASFKPNAFGLYDMLGNVWEWTLDCWHGDYQNAPADGSAWLDQNEGNCDRRVVRGGSWSDNPRNLRSADRDRGNTVDASDLLGFRVARAL